MAKISVHNLEGKKVEDIELSDSIFALPSNDDLLHQVYVAIAGNRRVAIAHTKDRSERSGSGIKPWRQKGTGNARVGERRNPVWRKGGVAFGPTKDRNFSKDVNKKMKQKAVLIALSEKIRKQELIIVSDLNIKERKTKEFAKALGSLKLTGKILVGFDEAEKDMRAYSRNIESVTNVFTRNLNVFDLLNNKTLVLSKSSIKYIEDKNQEK
ncbi:MAG TPA: 50S ribosomal protein L4 [Candidatus Moranbacteria bacterium]|nr:MAG: 50S ribosomal protein L4 [Candidatus Moranbacteria bacterium GW2011_GWC2_45_10]KKT95307.1 MAG: 50S ribosomal protein L4 [Parcubacteria group bacterium GW2011_GWC1_45_14]HAV10997.1 50S ribosomal protein L4 [Candidatus Moranbacteria bacterium]